MHTDGNGGYPLITAEALAASSPSRTHGIDWTTEVKLRRTCARLLHKVGGPNYLKLPRWTVQRAVIIFHRFYTQRSFRTNDRFLFCAASLYLACKIDSCWRSVEDVAKAIHTYRFHGRDNAAFALVNSRAFIDQQCSAICAAEMRMLYDLNFNCNIYLPDSTLGPILHTLGYAAGGVTAAPAAGRPALKPVTPRLRKALNMAYCFVNDSFEHTTLCLSCSPKALMAAALRLATSFYKFGFSLSAEGYCTALGVSHEQLTAIEATYKEMYPADQFAQRSTTSRSSDATATAGKGGGGGQAAAHAPAPALLAVTLVAGSDGRVLLTLRVRAGADAAVCGCVRRADGAADSDAQRSPKRQRAHSGAGTGGEAVSASAPDAAAAAACCSAHAGADPSCVGSGAKKRVARDCDGACAGGAVEEGGGSGACPTKRRRTLSDSNGAPRGPDTPSVPSSPPSAAAPSPAQASPSAHCADVCAPAAGPTGAALSGAAVVA